MTRDDATSTGFRLERDGSVGRIVIDRADRRNAFSISMWRALPRHVADLMADPNIRVLVVEGAGGKAFSAGADISEFAAERATPEGIARYDAANEAAYEALRGARTPVIAKIAGFCMGGGLGLALACDIRIASSDAVFAIPAARLGIGYPAPWVADLLRAVRPSVAKDMLFTARRIPADEALRVGLIDSLVPPEGLESTVAERTTAIVANAPLSITAAKRMVDTLTEVDLVTMRAELQDLSEGCFASDDYAEGRAAFLEKRPPRFTGR